MNKILKFSLILGIACPLTMASQEYTPGFEPTPEFDSTPVEQVTIDDTEIISTPIEETPPQIKNEEIMQMFNDLSEIINNDEENYIQTQLYLDFINIPLENMDSFINSNQSIGNEPNYLWRGLFLEYVQKHLRDISMDPWSYQSISQQMQDLGLMQHLSWRKIITFEDSKETIADQILNLGSFIRGGCNNQNEACNIIANILFDTILDGIKESQLEVLTYLSTQIKQYIWILGNIGQQLNDLYQTYAEENQDNLEELDSVRKLITDCGFTMD